MQEGPDWGRSCLLTHHLYLSPTTREGRRARCRPPDAQHTRTHWAPPRDLATRTAEIRRIGPQMTTCRPFARTSIECGKMLQIKPGPTSSWSTPLVAVVASTAGAARQLGAAPQRRRHGGSCLHWSGWWRRSSRSEHLVLRPQRQAPPPPPAYVSTSFGFHVLEAVVARTRLFAERAPRQLAAAEREAVVVGSVWPASTRRWPPEDVFGHRLVENLCAPLHGGRPRRAAGVERARCRRVDDTGRRAGAAL